MTYIIRRLGDIREGRDRHGGGFGGGLVQRSGERVGVVLRGSNLEVCVGWDEVWMGIEVDERMEMQKWAVQVTGNWRRLGGFSTDYRRVLLRNSFAVGIGPRRCEKVIGTF